jgi:hypothetical protein
MNGSAAVPKPATAGLDVLNHCCAAACCGVHAARNMAAKIKSTVRFIVMKFLIVSEKRNLFILV